MAEISPSEAQDSQNASWARTFRGSSTNLSQRKRYAENVAKDHVNRDVREASEFEGQLAGNKGLRDLFLGKQKAQLAERQFQFQKEKQDFMERRQADEMDLKLRNEKRAMERDERDRRNAMRIDDHTAAFESQIQDMLDNGLTEGSPGYAVGLMQVIRNNPFARKDLRDIAIKGARIKGDPDALNAYAEANGLEMSWVKVDPSTGEMEPTYSRKRVEPKGSTPSAKKTPDTVDQQLGRIQPEPVQTRAKEAAVGIGDAKEAARVDVNLAKALIKEANGDREKARALARERGYEF